MLVLMAIGKIRVHESDISWCRLENIIMEYRRGRRACLNLIRDPVDNYIEHKDEIEEVLKLFTVVPRNKISISDINQWLYVTSVKQDKRYVKAIEICKGSKIYSTDENDLYKLDKELNELGFKTKMGRNCDTGTLSIEVLEEPEEESYKINDICKDREALRPKYEQFIQTERGKEWKHFWQSQTGSERSGDFGDYLYDFYPEMLQ